ncbi:MAG: hypothetical protein NTX22_09040 [Ignavibacteriales bacterium]|nr:hypothetical protein [Ignavibacteriales bacterium]
MERHNYKKAGIFLTALMVIGLLAISNTGIVAQENNDCGRVIVNLSKADTQNFMSGLNSNNEGLRKSCIYFAGKYKISKAVLPLMSQLRKEEKANIRILISMALYQIGDARGLYLVKVISDNDENIKVRKRLSAIYDEYIKSNNNPLAAL